MLKKVFVLLSVALLAACRSLVDVAPDPKLTDFDLKDDEALLLIGIPAGSRLSMIQGGNRNGSFTRSLLDPKIVIIEGISRYNEAVYGYALRKIKLSEQEPGMAVWVLNHRFPVGCDRKTPYVELKPKVVNYFGEVWFSTENQGPGDPPIGKLSVVDRSEAAQKYISGSFPLVNAIIHKPELQWLPPAQSVDGHRCPGK